MAVLRIDDHRLPPLEHAQRLGVAGDLEVRLQLLEPDRRVVAERFEPARRPVPVADRALVDAHRAGQVTGHQVGDLARVEALGQLTAHVEQPPQLACQLLAAGQQPGRLERRRRVVGEDREQPQVVTVEPGETELGQRDDPDGDAVVAHRHDQHRLVDVVGARDRRAPGVAVRVVDEQRLAVLGDPAGEALAEPAAEQVEVHLLVGADPAFERDRHDLVGRLEQVHTGVVVVDDPARLLDDGAADGLDRGRPAQPTRCRLEHRQLGGPGLGLLEQLGVGERDAGVRGERRDECHVAIGPCSGFAGDRRERPDQPLVMEQRRDEIGADVEDPVIPLDAVAPVGGDVAPRGDTTGAQDLTDPALVDAEHRQHRGDAVRQARPGGHVQVVVAQDADVDVVDPERALRLVDDGPEQLMAIVRGGEPLGDPEHAVEPLGELGLQPGPARGQWIGLPVPVRRRQQSPEQRGLGRSRARGGSIAWSGTLDHRRDGPIAEGSRGAGQRYRVRPRVVLGRSP